MDTYMASDHDREVGDLDQTDSDADDHKPQVCLSSNSKPSMDTRMVLNVGGQRYVTRLSTLQRYPGTRLADLTRGDSSYDSQCGEYFFDRNPRMFPYILDFYRDGEIHFPHCMCGPFIKKELTYWNIPEDKISTCCWKTYKEFEDEKRTLDLLDQAFNGHRRMFIKEQEKSQKYRGQNNWTHWKMCILRFLEDPSYTKYSKIWAHFFMVMLLLSIAVVVAESHPIFRVTADYHEDRIQTIPNDTSPKLVLYMTTQPFMVIRLIDYACTFFFTLELIVRFFVWPEKLKFIFSFFNVLDLLSVCPMLALTMIRLIQPRFWEEKTRIFYAYCILCMSSVFRSIRIVKLVKHHRGLQIIYLAVKHSAKEILLLLLLIFIGTLVFSTMIYFAEFYQGDTFPSIPIGFWWAIITMTTVGYGDRHPTSAMGYLVGSGCAITGMLATGLPIPVIANSFHLYNTYARVKDTLDNRNNRLNKEQTTPALSEKVTFLS